MQIKQANFCGERCALRANVGRWFGYQLIAFRGSVGIIMSELEFFELLELIELLFIWHTNSVNS